MNVGRVRDILRLETEADDGEAESVRKRWRAAALIASELDAGTSARSLAAAIGKSHTHVLRMRRVWANFHAMETTVSTAAGWNDLYHDGDRYLPADAGPNGPPTLPEPEPQIRPTRSFLTRPVRLLRECPGCGLDLVGWVHEQEADRAKRGLEPRKPGVPF